MRKAQKEESEVTTMADRKLYHLVNGEFVLNGMPSVHVPTYAEVNAHIAMLRDVGFFDNPIAESVPAWDGLSNGKRTTEKQASLYDAMLAEIYAERDGEKAKVRNRRRADRKHKLTPKMRKEQEWMRNMHICNRYIGWGWDLLDNAKAESAEKIARADWELEQDEIAEDRDYAELEEEYREWERRYRHEKYMRNLNEWLKYA